MRQSGILAAAALHALQNHRTRLHEDHANARRLAAGLSGLAGLTVPLRVETNMVFFDLREDLGPAVAFCEKLKLRNVWMLPTGPQRIRAVCHLDVESSAIDYAVAAVREVASA